MEIPMGMGMGMGVGLGLAQKVQWKCTIK